MTPQLSPDLAAWRAARLAALTAEDGWLNLIDRVELSPGARTLGQGAGNDIRLSEGPDHLGRLVVVDGTTARLDPPGAAPLPFLPHPDAPPRLTVGNLLLELHTVEGQPALRVRRIDHPARAAFAGLRSFPFDPAWIIRAAWQRLEQPRSTGIAMSGGAQGAVVVTHRASFAHAGHDIHLLATHWKAGKPMFVFRDATSGTQTYAASRFLIGEDATEDAITLDFNRAFNPPCAFTDFAVCPLPPRENILPFAVRAGELAP